MCLVLVGFSCFGGLILLFWWFGFRFGGCRGLGFVLTFS